MWTHQEQKIDWAENLIISVWEEAKGLYILWLELGDVGGRNKSRNSILTKYFELLTLIEILEYNVSENTYRVKLIIRWFILGGYGYHNYSVFSLFILFFIKYLFLIDKRNNNTVRDYLKSSLSESYYRYSHLIAIEYWINEITRLYYNITKRDVN